MGREHGDEEMTLHRSPSFSDWVTPQGSPSNSGATNEGDLFCVDETLESFEDDAESVESPTKRRRFAWSSPMKKPEGPFAKSANLSQAKAQHTQQDRRPRVCFGDIGFGLRPIHVTLPMIPPLTGIHNMAKT